MLCSKIACNILAINLAISTDGSLKHISYCEKRYLMWLAMYVHTVTTFGCSSKNHLYVCKS